MATTLERYPYFVALGADGNKILNDSAKNKVAGHEKNQEQPQQKKKNEQTLWQQMQKCDKKRYELIEIMCYWWYDYKRGKSH